MAAIPREVDVIITQELIQRSGGFSDINHCPVATLFIELFQNHLEEGFLPQVSLNHAYIQCQDGLHKYKFNKSFLWHDLEEVISAGVPYVIKAYLEY